jgi:teichuronic acid biosynthesis glycosyltransferase TuaC
MYNVLSCCHVHPTAVRPQRGLFNGRSLSSLAQYTEAELEVVSPVPAAPSIGPYSTLSKLPEQEDYGWYSVYHPRFIYPVPKRLFKYTLAAKSFSRTVTRFAAKQFEPPDVVHAGHIFFDGYGMLEYCSRHDVPLYVMGWGYILNNYETLQRSGRKKVEKTLDFCDGVLCVSEDLRSRAEEITNPEKIHVVPHGADPNVFPTEHTDDIKNELRIPADQRVVLFCGSFTDRKGLHEIIEVMPEIDAPDTTFIFIGHHGDLRWELQEALNKSDVSSRIYWDLSPIAVRRLYAIADLLWLPSYAEGRPTVIYEAMASETAVLGTDIGGIREQVVDGETGKLVPAKDPDRLKAELLSLLSSEQKLREFGENGKQRLLQKEWTWEQHAQQVANIHRSGFRDTKDDL